MHAVLRFDEAEIDGVAVTENILGYFVREVDFEARQLPGGGITERQQVLRLLDANDQIATLHNRRDALCRGATVWFQRATKGIFFDFGS